MSAKSAEPSFVENYSMSRVLTNCAFAAASPMAALRKAFQFC